MCFLDYLFHMLFPRVNNVNDIFHMLLPRVNNIIQIKNYIYIIYIYNPAYIFVIFFYRLLRVDLFE